MRNYFKKLGRRKAGSWGRPHGWYGKRIASKATRKCQVV